ncbi:MAG TPA: SMC-Scp complex subunit ScpB [Mycobacteriales bacterium]|nr:SMC-Scp complex subunit ScpB [Mycobacteriales bacterium]
MSEQESAPPADTNADTDATQPASQPVFGANGTFGRLDGPNVPLDPDIAAPEPDEGVESGAAPESAVDPDVAPESEPALEPEPAPEPEFEDDLADQPAAASDSEPEPEAPAELTAESDVPAEPEPAADDSATAPVDEPTLDLVDPDRLRRAVEAVLLVVDEPVEVTTLAQTLSIPKPDVLTALTSLRDEYTEGERGMDLREVAGGWRLYSREEFAQYVERFVLDGQQTRLTQAALETLSVIAYRQPVTRSRVSAIRGVGVDGVMRTLTTRGLVEECGTDAETGGGLYRTTSLFLEKLGLNSIEELPPLAPLLPDHTDLEDSALTDG